MKRTPMKRGKPIARTTRVKAGNPKRKASEFQRCYGSRARVKWVQSLPCIVDDVAESGIPCGRSENAHVPSQSGAGRKGDARHIVPLCKWHHTQSIRTSLHALNKAGFNAYHDLDLDAIAATVEARWQASHPTPRA